MVVDKKQPTATIIYHLEQENSGVGEMKVYKPRPEVGVYCSGKLAFNERKTGERSADFIFKETFSLDKPLVDSFSKKIKSGGHRDLQKKLFNKLINLPHFDENSKNLTFEEVKKQDSSSTCQFFFYLGISSEGEDLSKSHTFHYVPGYSETFHEKTGKAGQFYSMYSKKPNQGVGEIFLEIRNYISNVLNKDQ